MIQATTPACSTPRPKEKGPRVTVGQILRRDGPDYLRAHRHELTRDQVRALVDAMQCRTAVLGGHWWECTGCGHLHRSFNSCHNRHCATCGEPRRGQWFDRVRSWVLPVHYYHAVFTVPHRLNELIGANRRVFYRLQFRATARALVRRAADPLERLGGVKIGLVTVLHTWGQAMRRHIHSHVLLPGGGFSLDDGRWVSSPGREFFLDAARLAEAYRDTYLRSLRKKYRAGELVFPGELAPLADAEAFDRFIRPLQEIRWVIDCGSPEHVHRPEAALDYLARYVVGSAISDARIVSDEQGQVTIRIKDYRHEGARGTISMPGQEFVRRFLLHVLPPGMARVCYGGFLGNRHRKENLEQARTQLAVVTCTEIEETAAECGEPSDRESELETETETETETKMACPRCGQFRLAWLALIPAAGTWRARVNMIPRVVRRRIERERAAALDAPDASASNASSPVPIRGPPLARPSAS